ncbi:MAG: response regulator [Bacteroidetes bacterium]|jgi:CheY-like chemotaxis protein|nr:response regulator [Bacteroidota bacterium]MDF2452882.1 response regulator [Bacteroidota bacterium]
MNILIIEDDKLTLHSLKHVIESLGHKVVLAENAEEAMNKIVDGKFDLVFSDIMMPGISGLSLLTILRTVHLVKTPIVAMSILNDKPVVEAAFAAGANDFMVKPFTLEGLTETLNKFDANFASDVEKSR